MRCFRHAENNVHVRRAGAIIIDRELEFYELVDFSSLRRFKCSIKLIDFSKFLTIDVDS